jgi:hypothetical protein
MDNQMKPGRLTLRDINMQMAAEDSSLDSGEDPEHYLQWL